MGSDRHRRLPRAHRRGDPSGCIPLESRGRSRSGFPSKRASRDEARAFWRGPDWRPIHDAFTAVTWEWVAAAIGLNLLSVVFRAVAWDTAITQSIAPPHPRFPLVFSAFAVGLFANAVLPGRVGELARVAVLRRRMAGRKGTTATLVGSVFGS